MNSQKHDAGSSIPRPSSRAPFLSYTDKNIALWDPSMAV